MADITDPTVIATIVQTVVITLTLVVFIFQFRSQEKAIREASYQNVMGRYNDYIMSEREEDDALLARFLGGGMNPSPQEISEMRRLMIAYGIIEEAYILYKKKWIDKETWDQWGAWLADLSRHPHFRMLHTRAAGMFDKDFQAHVSRLLESTRANP